MFEGLANLGKIDLALSQLKHQLGTIPELTAFREIKLKMDKIAKEMDDVVKALDAFHNNELKLEDARSKISMRIQSIQSEAQNNTSLSYRDQEVMATELSSLLEQQSNLEDEELLCLGEEDLLAEKQGVFLKETEACKTELFRLQKEIAAEQHRIKEQIRQLEDRRLGIAMSIDPDLMAVYTGIYERYQDSGVAHITGSRCSGCHLQLSTGEIAICKSEPNTIHYCEHCGRILIPAEIHDDDSNI